MIQATAAAPTILAATTTAATPTVLAATATTTVVKRRQHLHHTSNRICADNDIPGLSLLKTH